MEYILFQIFEAFSQYLNFRIIIYCAVYLLLFVAHQMSIFEIIVSSDVINVVPKCMYAQSIDLISLKI